ncbi:zinc finger domain-containing protein [Fervidicoccus fontis]|nr:zinc finger domain-containing protein [Fervidicoccus fontis]
MSLTYSTIAENLKFINDLKINSKKMKMLDVISMQSSNVASKLSVHNTVKTRTCTSCGKTVSPEEKPTIFLCPNCGQVEIVRCSKCKKQGVKYKCPVCGFEGP